MDEEKKEFLSDYSSLDVYFQEAVKAVANVAKSSNGIPSDTKDNWDFYSTFTDFRKVMNVQSDQVRSMIENILLHNGVKVHVPKNSGVTTKVEDILEMLAEANDNLLERIQTNLDDAEGLVIMNHESNETCDDLALKFNETSYLHNSSRSLLHM